MAEHGLTPDFGDLLDSFDDPTTGGFNTGNSVENEFHHTMDMQRHHQVPYNTAYTQQQVQIQSYSGNNPMQNYPIQQLQQHEKSILGMGIETEDIQLQPGEDASQDGSSLGTMFLSSVEDMLSQNTNAFSFERAIQQKITQPKPPNKKSKPRVQKILNPVQSVASFSPENIMSVQHNSPINIKSQNKQQMFMHQNVNRNTGMNVKPHLQSGMNVNQQQQPFVTPGENKQEMIVLNSDNFVRPGVHHKPPTPGQPPRPLSSSSYVSAQPSPANSNHSGDPPTPSSYHAGTPQSNRSVTPIANPPTHTIQDQSIQQQGNFMNDISNQSLHEQTLRVDSNIPESWNNAGMGHNSSMNFDNRNLNSNSTSGYSSAYQSDTSVLSGENHTSRPISNIIADNNYGNYSVGGINSPANKLMTTHEQVNKMNFSEPEANLTSKQSRLLDQMSAGLSTAMSQKSQISPVSNSSSTSMPNIRNEMHQPEAQFTSYLNNNARDKQQKQSSDETINMINRASTSVKDLLSNTYEAISPASDYVASPVSKSNDAQVDATEMTNVSNKPEFSSQTMTDPVLMYLKDASVADAQPDGGMTLQAQSVSLEENSSFNTHNPLNIDNILHTQTSEYFSSSITSKSKSHEGDVLSNFMPTTSQSFGSHANDKFDNMNSLLYKKKDIPQAACSNQGFFDPTSDLSSQTKRATGRRKSINNEKTPKRRTSKQSKKKDSQDEDFNFGSDEPTIRLSGMENNAVRVNPQTVNKQFQNITNTNQGYNKLIAHSLPVDSEMQNSMHEIAQMQQQHKAMMQKLQEIQQQQQQRKNLEKKEKHESYSKVQQPHRKNGASDRTSKNTDTVKRSSKSSISMQKVHQNKSPDTMSFGETQNIKNTLTSNTTMHRVSNITNKTGNQFLPNAITISSSSGFIGRSHEPVTKSLVVNNPPQFPPSTFVEAQSPNQLIRNVSVTSNTTTASQSSITVTSSTDINKQMGQSKLNQTTVSSIPSSTSGHFKLSNISKKPSQSIPINVRSGNTKIESHPPTVSKTNSYFSIANPVHSINAIPSSTKQSFNQPLDFTSIVSAPSISDKIDKQVNSITTNRSTTITNSSQQPQATAMVTNQVKSVGPVITSSDISTASTVSKAGQTSLPILKISNMSSTNITTLPTQTYPLPILETRNSLPVIDSNSASNHSTFLHGYGNMPISHQHVMHHQFHPGVFQAYGFPPQMQINNPNLILTSISNSTGTVNTVSTTTVESQLFSSTRAISSSTSKSKTVDAQVSVSTSLTTKCQSPVSTNITNATSHNSFDWLSGTLQPASTSTVQYIPPVMPSRIPPPSIVGQFSSTSLANAIITEKENKNFKNFQHDTTNLPNCDGETTSVKSITTVSSSVTTSTSIVNITTTISSPKQTVSTIANPVFSDASYYGPKKQKLREASLLNAMSNSSPSVATNLVSAANVTKVSVPESPIIKKINNTGSFPSTTTQALNVNAHNNKVLEKNKEEVKVQPTKKKPIPAPLSLADLSTHNAASVVEKVQVPNQRNENTGQMFSLFDSLLKEVSKTAADALKTKTSNKSPKGNRSNNTEQVISSNSEPQKELQAKHFHKQAISAVAAASAAQTNPSVAAAISNVNKTIEPTGTINSTNVSVGDDKINKKSDLPVSIKHTDTVAQTAEPKKVPKPSRPYATFPFKRRPYPDPETFQTSNVNSVITTTTSNNLANTATVGTLKQVKQPELFNNVNKSNVRTVASTTTTSVKNIVTINTHVTTNPTATTTAINAQISISSSVSSMIPSTLPETVLLPTTAVTSSSGGGGIKIKITAFRSSGGKVIHQSSVLNKNCVVDSDGSDITYKKKSKKRKKKKKSKRLLSSSDYDSSVSSVTSVSSYEPSTKSQRIEKSTELSAIAMLKNLNKAISRNSAVDISPSSPISIENTKKNLKRKMKPCLKNGGSDQDKAKKMKGNNIKEKKKSELNKKDNVVRYKPKFVQQTSNATTSTKLSPIQVQRIVGKTPSYLNVSKSSNVTNSVPTIQLVARNTTILQSSIQDKTSTTSKPVQVKSVNRTSKTQIVQIKPGVQYVLNAPGSHILLPQSSVSGTKKTITPSTSTKKTSSVHVYPMSSANTNTLTVSALSGSSTSVVTASPALSNQIKQCISSASSPKIKYLINNGISVANSKSIPILSSCAIQISPPMIVTTLLSNPKSSASSDDKSSVATPKATPLSSNNHQSNAFQTTFSKLVNSQNPLAKYTPPSPPAKLKVEQPELVKKFKCLECGDTFMFEANLEHHYERRSIIIKVCCVQCKQVVVFLNKCKFLKHAREHSEKGAVMQFNGAHIKPIPIAMCKPQSKDEYAGNDSNDKEKYSLGQLETKEDKALSSAFMMACTECNFLATSQQSMEEHFQRRSQESNGSSTSCQTCDMCHLTLYNNCSFYAHMRVHKRVSPYTCPECGQIFDSTGSEFNSHLSLQCYHSCRMSCYKCKLCNDIFQTGKMLKRHLMARHVQTFYKCRECPMAFKTEANITSHQRSVHSMAPEPFGAMKTIYKCPLCDTVFTDNNDSQQLWVLQKHFDTHLTQKTVNITTYKCKVCAMICEKKEVLREHLRAVHDVVCPVEFLDNCSLLDIGNLNKNDQDMLKSTNKNKTESIPEKKSLKSKNTNYNNIEENDSQQLPDVDMFDDNDSIRSHSPSIADNSDDYVNGEGNHCVKKTAKQPLKLRFKGMKSHASSNNHLVPNKANATSGSMADGNSSLPDTEMITKEINGKKVFFCPHCDKEFNSSHSRWSHIRLKHQGIRNLYCCPHCGTENAVRFAKRISLVKHLKKVHALVQIKKSDVRVISAKVMPSAVGQRFDPSTVIIGKNGTATSIKSPDKNIAKNSPRKKVTGTAANKRRPKPNLAECSIINKKRKSFESTDEDVSYNIEDITADDFNFPDVYSCAKCQYQSGDRNDFQDHIEAHRESTDDKEFPEAYMFQCSECGLCFTSTASLSKHLFIKHKIKSRKKLELFNVKTRSKYKAEADGEQRNTSMHICKVCYKRFDEDGQLRTHMRTHGLAFVKSKHTANS